MRFEARIAPAQTPRERLLDLCGEAFANGRDAEAMELRRLVLDLGDEDVAGFGPIAEYMTGWWEDVMRTLRLIHDALPKNKDKAA